MEITLNLGEFRIRLHEPNDRACFYWPQWMFEPFHADCAGPADIDLVVRVTESLPDPPQGRLIFDACHGLWTLHEAGEGYFLETLNTLSHKPLNRVWLDKDYARGQVWTRPHRHHSTRRRGWAPAVIINPVVELCLLTRLAREGGVLMHGAGIAANRNGLVFSGVSGAGKSTMADFYLAQDQPVLSDERIIIRKIGNRFLLCGTPWHGTSRAVDGRVVPLDCLYFIRHGSGAHRLRKLPALQVCQWGLQQCFLPHWDREGMAKTVDFFSELAERIDSYDLAFLNQPDVIEFLQQQRGTPVKSAAV